MKISQMDKKIILQERVISLDEYGVEHDIYINLDRIWAYQENITYKTINKGSDERFQETYRFIIRRRKDLEDLFLENIRIDCDGKKYKVISIKSHNFLYQEIITRRFTDE